MWSGAPAATKQFAMIMAPTPTPSSAGGNLRALGRLQDSGCGKACPAELPMDRHVTTPTELAGTIQGLSGFRRAGYRGPAPPPGKPHHYTFTVYALDTELTLAEGATKGRPGEGDGRPHHRAGLARLALRALQAAAVIRREAGL
jgi:phosphatidylethanolamine-binding protein (PEBP) family uncharacterized protein